MGGGGGVRLMSGNLYKETCYSEAPTRVWCTIVNHLFLDCSRCSSLGTCLDPGTKHQHLLQSPDYHEHLLSRHTNCLFFPLSFCFPLFFLSSLVYHFLIPNLFFLTLFCYLSLTLFFFVPFVFLQTKSLACQEKAPHTAQPQTR